MHPFATAEEASLHAGALYLFMKTPERAHLPSKMWERVKLSNDYGKALEQIDTELQYWPKFLIHKCKQRTTKIVQYLIKMRKLRMREGGKLVPIKKKLERREAIRETKALAAAKLEKNLEKELVARLKSRAYGDMPLNVNEDVWNAVLERERLEAEREGEEALELEQDDDSLDEEDLESENEGELEQEFDEQDREYIEDFDESDAEDLEDLDNDNDDNANAEDSSSDEDDQSDDDGSRRAKKRKLASSKAKGKQALPAASKKPRRGAGPRVEVEYEMEGPARERVLA